MFEKSEECRMIFIEKSDFLCYNTFEKSVGGIFYAVSQNRIGY